MLPHLHHGNLPSHFLKQTDMLKWVEKHHSTAAFCARHMVKNAIVHSCLEVGCCAVLCLHCWFICPCHCSVQKENTTGLPQKHQGIYFTNYKASLHGFLNLKLGKASKQTMERKKSTQDTRNNANFYLGEQIKKSPAT